MKIELMDLRKKNIVYTLILVAAIVVVYFYRKSTNIPIIEISGTTMGAIPYSIKYFDSENRNLKPEIDSLLIAFNASLSTYIPESEISQFNNDSVFSFKSPYFYPVLDVSKKVYTSTGGAYDPSVMPLVNIWGFGPDKSNSPDSIKIDSILSIIGFDKIQFSQSAVWKEDRRVQLDFSASAKGFGVDVVLEFLQSKGLENIFVEIGGEVRAQGENIHHKSPWRIGILNPNSTREQLSYIATVDISNRAIATSGNYFNYRVINGQKFSHTINPLTGYPIQHPLLSASVLAATCLEADALATAFMVMGHQKSISYLETHPEIDAFLIFSDSNDNLSTYMTSGVEVSLME